MPQLLRVDAGVRTESMSRELTGRFATNWQASTDGTVVHRDLALNPVPHVTTALGDHFVYRPGSRPDNKPDEVRLSEALVAELRSADALLLGLPMHNFSIPSALKAWIDHVVWPGLTFSPEGSGLLSMPAVVICTRGGGYGPGSPKESWNFQEPYLRKVLSFIGINDAEFINVEFTMFTGEESARPDLGLLGVDSMQRAARRLEEFPYSQFGTADSSSLLAHD
jgi:FMN-dependent NADH-azoreductase